MDKKATTKMIKRKRNKKLENEVKYDVLVDAEVDPALLEAYKVSNLSTGMEAEEEKELHLKNIIAQGSGDIPTPVVSVQARHVRHSEYKRPRDFIRWDGDAPNETVLDRDDVRILRERGIGEEEFMGLLGEGAQANCADAELGGYISRRVLKVIGDDSLSDAYACFRKRVPKLPRKSRRSETNVNERLKRMWAEFGVLKNLYALHLRRCELEREYVECNRSILDIGLRLEPGDRLRRRIERKLFRRRRSSKQAEYYKSCGPFSELACNYEKIKALKDFLHKLDPKISSLDLEREAKAFENYKRRKFNSKEET